MKVLVVQTKNMGDVLFSSAICNTIKLNENSAAIDFICRDFCKGMILNNPNIRNIITIDEKKKNNLFYMLKILLKIRKEKYDIIVNAQGQLTGFLICLFSKAKIKTGFDFKYWKLLQTHNIDYHKDAKNYGFGLTVDHRLALLNPLKFKKISSYKIFLSEKEKEHGKKLFQKSGIDLKKPIVALGVNSLGEYKNWPKEHYAKLIEKLLAHYDIQIWIYFSPREKNYNLSIKKMVPLKYHEKIFTNVETKNIREFISALNNCDFFIGNETGPRSISQGLNIPAFVIVSPTGEKNCNPTNNSKYRAVDLQDKLKINNEKYKEIASIIIRGQNDLNWFGKIDPDFVYKEIEKMIVEEKIFITKVS